MENNIENVPLENSKEKKESKIFLFIVSIFLIAITIGMILYSFLFYHVTIVGSSMSPTLKNGEVLLVNKYAKAKRGDIVIIHGEASNNNLLVKRVIGIGGDTVTIKDGYVFINGEKQIESYLLVQGETFYPDVTDRTNKEEHTWVIEEGQVFYLGDNRKNSSDSRASSYGVCEISQIDGVIKNFALKIRGVTKAISNFVDGVKGIFNSKG